MIFILCILTSLFVFLIIALPFFIGGEEDLSFSHFSGRQKDLEQAKEQVLQAYLEAEKLFEEQKLSSREWAQRQSFLCNRYIDLSRSLDRLSRSSES